MKFWKYFQRYTASDIRLMQLQDAECLALLHSAAAEHNQALADMYQARVTRLSERSHSPIAVTLKPAN